MWSGLLENPSSVEMHVKWNKNGIVKLENSEREGWIENCENEMSLV